jgi:hypothetical protein
MEIPIIARPMGCTAMTAQHRNANPKKYLFAPPCINAKAKARARGKKRNLATSLSSGRRWTNSPPQAMRDWLRCMRKKRAYKQPENSAAFSLSNRMRART